MSFLLQMGPSVRVRFRKVIAIVLSLHVGAALVLAFSAEPAKAAAGGPVILTGIDAEDCGPGGHGPIGNYVDLVDDLLSKTTNGGEDILVIGANGPAPRGFWNAIATGTGKNVIFGNENSAFTGKQMIGVVSSAPQMCGGEGLTEDQNNVLSGRQSDFATFINEGGGLLGNTQAGLTNQFGYVATGLAGGVVLSASSEYSNIDPTPDGESVGVTNALDVCCWHNHFTQIPGFLRVLAYSAGTKNEAAIGGNTVLVPPNECKKANGPDEPSQYDQSATCKYLALGDSFSSGQSVPPYYDYSQPHNAGHRGNNVSRCHRSKKAYGPNYLASNFDLKFHACSGDEIPDFDGTNAPWAAACGSDRNQMVCIDTVQHSDDLLTLSIGGNDVGFSAVLRECFTVEFCQSYNRPGRKTLEARTLAEISKLKPELEVLYREIRESAGDDTSVVVLGYPHLFPDLAGCCQPPPANCNRYGNDEREFINLAGTKLAQAISESATATGMHYIDVIEAFRSHEACGSNHKEPGEWINGPSWPAADSFHPKASGQKAYTQALSSFIAGWTGARTDVGLPKNPPTSSPLAAPVNEQTDSASDDLSYDDLVVDPVVPSITESCEDIYQPGQEILVQGEEFAPSTQIAVTYFSSDGSQVHVKDVTSGPTGSIAEALTLPANLQSDDLGVLEAYGDAIEGGGLVLNAMLGVNAPPPPSPALLGEVTSESCDLAAAFGSAQTLPTAPSFNPQSVGVDSQVTDRTDSNVNGIFEVGETVQVKPTWKNEGTEPVRITGSLSAFTGSPGFSYDIVKSNGDYGTVGAGQTGSCQADDCYLLAITQDADSPPTLPIEASVLETLSNGSTKKWTVKLSGLETLRPDTVTSAPSFSAQTLEVDTQSRPESSSNLNGNFDFGETVVVKPSWKNGDTSPIPVQGTISAFTGPPGAGYEILDGGADYGTLDPGQTGSCAGADHCYVLRVRSQASQLPTLLPPEAKFVETLSNGATHDWTLNLQNGFPPSFSLSPATYSAEEGGGAATITVERRGDKDPAVEVNYATSNGTAVAGADYPATSGTLSFRAGETTKTFSVPITNDAAPESNETLNIGLSSPSNGSVLGSPSTGTLTIVDNDAQISLGSSALSIPEHAEAASVTINRSGAPSSAVSATIATANGTAMAGSDYTGVSASVQFAAGETSKTVSIPIIEDSQVEASETIGISLSSPTGGAVLTSPSSATLTIVDNDASIVFGATSYSMNEDGGSAIVTVNRQGFGPSSVGVSYSTSDGSATAGADYTSASGSLAFGPNETSKTFSIPLTSDALAERDETVNLSLSSPTGWATIGSPATAILTIVNKDPVISFSSSTYSTLEPNSDTPTQITVVREGPVSAAVTVNYSTSNGTAVVSADYKSSSGTLAFGPGETTKTFAVVIESDNVTESEETVNLSLTGPGLGAVLISPSTAVLTIRDNDAEISFLNDVYEVDESAGVATITVERTGGISMSASAVFKTGNGYAEEYEDFIPKTETVLFGPGESTKTVTVAILDDSVDDSPSWGYENVQLDLDSPSSGASLGDDNAQLRILENDP